MKIPLPQVAFVLGCDSPATSLVTGWSIDSRTVEPGDLFFALRGPNHDGHDHVAAALDRGAVAAVVEKEVPGPALRTAGVSRALEALATWARKRWSRTVVGITGSAGKTTTKEVVAALLSCEMPVGKTTGNLNNHLGVPLSVLRIPDEAQTAVLEIGMNHAGEIRQLCAIARPEIAVVTNVGYAHVENFESIEGVSLAKRELVECLPAGGTAVLNADDPRVTQFARVHTGTVVTYGIREAADVRATEVEYRAEGARFRVDGETFEIALPGRIGVLNVLAGLAVAKLWDIPPARLAEAARSLAPMKMRGERLSHGGATIINDSYNANPDAMKAMIDLLRDTPATRRIAVLGEMLELGRWSETLHREIGNYAAVSGISVLIGVCGAARSLVASGREAGIPGDAALFFDTPEAAGQWLKENHRAGDAILFKGSRGTRVERALERFVG